MCLLLSISFLQNPAHGNDKKAGREVHFPTLLPLGQYAVCDKVQIESMGINYFSSTGSKYWKSSGAAKGLVHVPPGEMLLLEVDMRWQDCGVDLSPLAKLRPDDLYGLDISNHCLGDEQVKEIAGLTSIVALNLAGTGVGDAGLAYLENFGKLRILYLAGTRVGDAGLANLKDLISLQYLDLNETKVSDTGLLYLENLSALERLNLSSSNLTDAGIASLAKLSSLRELYINRTRVSEDGLAQLKAALPSCRIFHSESIEEYVLGENP
jgi:Leucine-rich repeat (LRR) protein